MIRWQVVECSSAHAHYYQSNEKNELECAILGTFNDHAKAVEFLSQLIGKNHDINGGWIRVYHETSESVSVYHVGLMGGKYLICKYHILEFEDN